MSIRDLAEKEVVKVYKEFEDSSVIKISLTANENLLNIYCKNEVYKMTVLNKKEYAYDINNNIVVDLDLLSDYKILDRNKTYDEMEIYSGFVDDFFESEIIKLLYKVM